MKTTERFSLEAINHMRFAIADAQNNEVLFCAKLNSEGVLDQVVTAARGLEDEVLALFPHMVQGDVVIHNHPSGRLKPSRADMAIASQLGNNGIGFYIIDNLAVELYCVAEPIKLDKTSPLNIDELMAVLDKTGPLSKMHRGYEVRPAQLGLVRFVAEAFNNNDIAIAEGGTGVGKSFAYLVPAIAWAKQNQKRIIVSTATIALQEQLFKKDVPTVKKILKADIKVIIAKGRQNYLCLLHLAEMMEEESLFLNENDELMQIDQWSKVTKTGDKAELGFVPKGSLWAGVISESDTCLGIRCTFYDQCFIFKARKEAASAHLIIANHHLLFADMSLREETEGEGLSILPPYQKIIFDEAHNIENSAVSFFSDTLNVSMVSRQLNRFHRRKRGQFFGVLPALEALLPNGYGAKMDRLYKALDHARQCADQLHNLSMANLEQDFRLTGSLSLVVHQSVIEPMDELSQALSSLSALASSLLEQLDEEEVDKSFFYEAKATISRTQNIAAQAAQFLTFADNEQTVFWGERVKNANGNHYYRYIATPLDIGPKMKSAVYDRHESIVMLSATLAIRGDFSFFKKRVGLATYKQRPLQEALFPSPFLYNEQAILAIPTDAPDPTIDSTQYDQYTATFLLNLFKATEGRGLVLFTSYRALQEVYEAVRAPLTALGILVLRQGEDDRNRLIKKFEKHGHAVLLGTDSFWEGIDIDNQYLKSVVICRLPFTPPSAPLAQARHELIAKHGGNPFIELQEPQMAIKLKQGFGRLIRKGSDYGAVFIIDNRIIKKNYGKRLIDGLPPAKKMIDSEKNILRNITSFLNS